MVLPVHVFADWSNWSSYLPFLKCTCLLEKKLICQVNCEECNKDNDLLPPLLMKYVFREDLPYSSEL